MNKFFCLGKALFLCLVLAAMAARCQTVGGIFVSNVMDLEGNNITIDSFDSSDPNHSIWQTNMTYHGMPYGLYSDTLSYVSNSFPSHTANALVATDGSIINVGNANIYGYVDAAPGSIAEVAANGAVGDLNWVYNGTPGIEPGHAYDDLNLVFHSVVLPTPITPAQSTWWPVPVPPGGSTNIHGTSYTLYITNNPATGGNYAYYSINQLNQSIYINASNVVLYLTNGWSYSGNNTFTLNTNSDVQIYTSGNVSTSGNAEVNNYPNYAKALSLYDVAGYSLIFSFAGNGIGSGFIYAPSSSIRFLGGGSATYGVVGEIFCNNLTLNGHYNFHFDTALGGVYLPVQIIQQPTNQIVPVNANPVFSVQATGPSPAYQWFFDQTNPIFGAVNPSLALSDVQLTNAGIYSVVVSNYDGAVTSALASLTVYTNAAATMSGTLNATNGQFELNVAGVAGLSYEVQASSNLVNWTTLWTNTSPFSLVESNSATWPQEFYRSVFVQ